MLQFVSSSIFRILIGTIDSIIEKIKIDQIKNFLEVERHWIEYKRKHTVQDIKGKSKEKSTLLVKLMAYGTSRFTSNTLLYIHTYIQTHIHTYNTGSVNGLHSLPMFLLDKI